MLSTPNSTTPISWDERSAVVADTLVAWLETASVRSGCSRPRWSVTCRCRSGGCRRGVPRSCSPFARLVTTAGARSGSRDWTRLPRGFVLQFDERWAANGQQWYAREVDPGCGDDDLISEFAVYCTGDWDEAPSGGMRRTVNLRPAMTAAARRPAASVALPLDHGDGRGPGGSAARARGAAGLAGAGPRAAALYARAAELAAAEGELDVEIDAALGLARCQQYNQTPGSLPVRLHEPYQRTAGPRAAGPAGERAGDGAGPTPTSRGGLARSRTRRCAIAEEQRRPPCCSPTPWTRRSPRTGGRTTSTGGATGRCGWATSRLTSRPRRPAAGAALGADGGLGGARPAADAP